MTPEERKVWRQKRDHIAKLMYSIRKRAEAKEIPFNLDHKYLCAIAPSTCPVFKIPLRWGYGHGTAGHAGPDSPSLDRIIPDRGYAKGNVAWISQKANSIKSNADEKELYAVADWLHQKRKEVIHGGAIPPRMDEYNDSYVVIPAGTSIVNDDDARKRGGY